MNCNNEEQKGIMLLTPNKMKTKIKNFLDGWHYYKINDINSLTNIYNFYFNDQSDKKIKPKTLIEKFYWGIYYCKQKDYKKMKEYYFEIMGEERVYTSLGSFKTIKVQHKRYKKEKNITLWCAPELNYLPVKIIQEETGKPTFISTLISYQEGMTTN